jgi:flagella basal body P-ring formation protein FlgA
MSTLSLLLLLQSTLVADLATVHPLDREVVTRAMRGALAENMNLEIVEISQFPVPDGEIAFDWKDLTPPAAGQSTARWRGVVRRDADHPFSIWAVVRVTAPCERVIAAQTIRPDEPIKASQLREESYQGFPSESCAVGIDGVIGKVATLTLSANTPIVRAMPRPS